MLVRLSRSIYLVAAPNIAVRWTSGTRSVWPVICSPPAVKCGLLVYRGLFVILVNPWNRLLPFMARTKLLLVAGKLRHGMTPGRVPFRCPGVPFAARQPTVRPVRYVIRILSNVTLTRRLLLLRL